MGCNGWILKKGVGYVGLGGFGLITLGGKGFVYGVDHPPALLPVKRFLQNSRKTLPFLFCKIMIFFLAVSRSAAIFLS